MIAFLLATTLSFTLPATEADTSRFAPDPCSGTNPLRDLDSVFVWYAARWNQPRVIFRASVRGMEGQRMNVTVPDSHATVFVVTADTAGNLSCHSNYLGLHPPTLSVPGIALDSLHSRDGWYDLLGRKLKGPPTASGLYWRVQGNRPRKIVRIR